MRTRSAAAPGGRAGGGGGRLPASATLAVASRRQLPLPVARMRVQRLVAEIGPRDLALTRTEAARVLADAGHELDHDTLDLLLQRTEGWPAAVALAALYLGDGGSRPNLARFDGSDRLVADYVRDEVLGDCLTRRCRSPCARASPTR